MVEPHPYQGIFLRPSSFFLKALKCLSKIEAKAGPTFFLHAWMPLVINPTIPKTNTTASGTPASDRLEAGTIYTRDDLRTMFNVKDASLNNGIFRPKGYDSVWLFITEHKTSDRTQYVDSLSGDVLHMQGQRSGRTDGLILNHLLQGLELLVFYRKAKYEYPYAGFRYEGIFNYHSHSGSLPTSFVLKRKPSLIHDAALYKIELQLSTQGEFDPKGLIDARTRIEASIVRRRGQSEFRKRLIKAYKGRCAITACSLHQVLEAAHIYPYFGVETNVVCNGLLLRADVHTLFDLGLWWIDPTSLKIELSAELRDSEYASIEGKSPFIPDKESERPSRQALEARMNMIASSQSIKRA